MSSPHSKTPWVNNHEPEHLHLQWIKNDCDSIYIRVRRRIRKYIQAGTWKKVTHTRKWKTIIKKSVRWQVINTHDCNESILPQTEDLNFHLVWHLRFALVCANQNHPRYNPENRDKGDGNIILSVCTRLRVIWDAKALNWSAPAKCRTNTCCFQFGLSPLCLNANSESWFKAGNQHA